MQNKNLYPLFIYEMANNHMGDLKHGIKIIETLRAVSDDFPNFKFAVKLQYRDDSFFHPLHINRTDHKLIKRFVETRLGEKKFAQLIKAIISNKFIPICTPWDEKAVDYLEKQNIQIYKIASCSFNDWDLLERISKTRKPVIASTAGASKLSIDKVNSFFKHKKINFNFMHCVGEYPTNDKDLRLDQIDYLIKNYPGVNIGWSTHENPYNFGSIMIAVAKGATIFEKHVGLEDKGYKLNLYSANPNQIRQWLSAAHKAFEMGGDVKTNRKSFNKKEIDDLRILYRGAYAKENIRKGQMLKKKYFLAMPNVENQLVASDLGKFNKYTAVKNIEKNSPLFMDDFELDYYRGNVEDKKFIIKDKVLETINKFDLILPKQTKAEISHHYGINNFFKKGAILFHIVNKEYSKIVVMMFPKQEYPAHFHVAKNETYFIIHGDLTVKVGKKNYYLKRGDMLSVNKKEVHSFKTTNGVVFEEIASKYIKNDSKYLDKMKIDKKRKSIIEIFNL